MKIYLVGMIFYLFLFVLSIIEGEFDNSSIVGILFFLVLILKQKESKEKDNKIMMYSHRIDDLSDNIKLKEESVENMKKILSDTEKRNKEQSELIEEQNDLIEDMRNILIKSEIVSEDFFK